jgi:hypothetical protein
MQKKDHDESRRCCLRIVVYRVLDGLNPQDGMKKPRSESRRGVVLLDALVSHNFAPHSALRFFGRESRHRRGKARRSPRFSLFMRKKQSTTKSTQVEVVRRGVLARGRKGSSERSSAD